YPPGKGRNASCWHSLSRIHIDPPHASCHNINKRGDYMTTTLNKIAYEKLQDQVVVDIRDNTTFRQGHLPNSLNVTANQKDKYWDGLVKNKENIVILTDKEESLADFEDLDANAYILFEDIQQEVLGKSAEKTADRKS